MRKYRILAIVLSAIFVVTSLPVQTFAISDKKLTDIYDNWIYENGGGEWHFGMYDITNDGIKDAVVYEFVFSEIKLLTYSEKTKRVKELLCVEWNTPKASTGFKKKNIYVSIIDSGTTTTTFYKIKKGKAVKIKTAVCYKNQSRKKKYKINGRKVTKKKYIKLFKGYRKYREYTRYWN